MDDILRELEVALRIIADDPEQSYDYHKPSSDSDRQYGIGVADGHRCCALTARQALEKLEKFKSKTSVKA